MAKATRSAVLGLLLVCVAVAGWRLAFDGHPDAAARSPGSPIPPAPTAPRARPGASEPSEPRGDTEATARVDSGAQGACELSVHVTRRNGRPVEGARCELRRADDWSQAPSEIGIGFVPPREPSAPLAAATTDATGEARVAGLPEGRFRVAVSAPALQRAEAIAVCVTGAPRPVVPVMLDDGHALVGTVRSADLIPAPGVSIVVAPPPGATGPSSDTYYHRAGSDAAGAWQVGGLAPGGWDVWVWREGRGFLRQGHVTVPEVQRFDVVLVDGATLAGRVTEELTGAPVRDARITLWSGAWEPFAKLLGEALSDSEGRYRVRTYESSVYVEKIAVVAAGRARRIVTDRILLEDAAPATLDFQLAPESRIEGRVLGPAGPVAGARVSVWTEGTGPFREAVQQRTTSDGEGRFAVGALAPGTASLWVDAQGFVDPRTASHAPPGRRPLDSFPAESLIELRAGEVRTVDVRLEAAADPDAVTIRISGVVYLPDGTPAAGAEVWTSAYGAGASRGFWLSEVTKGLAGADGSFSLSVTGTPGNFGIQARAPKCETVEQKFLEERPIDHDGVVLRLTPLPLVRGRVAASAPVDSGMRVRLGQRRGGRGGEYVEWSEPTPTARDGGYELALWTNKWPRYGTGMDWGEGGYVLLAEAEGHAPAISAAFTSADAAKGLTIDLRLEAGADLRGRIVDVHSKRGVPDVEVFLRPNTPLESPAWPPQFGPFVWDNVAARTDASGVYVIRGLRTGPYRVDVAADAYAPEERELQIAASGTADFELTPALPISGTVVDAAGSPVADVEVLVRHPNTGFRRSGSPERTARDGRFQIEPIREGSYRLEAIAHGEGPSLAPAEMTVAAGATGVHLELAAGPVVAGRLLDTAGAPVADESLYVQREGGGLRKYADGRTDANGRFAVKHVAPGTYTVTFKDVGLSFEGVRAGAPVELRFPGDMTASGRLLDPDGKPVVVHSLGWFEARPLVPGSGPRVVHFCSPGKDGIFTFLHMAPGEYEAGTSTSWLRAMADDRKSYWVLPRGTRMVAGRDAGTFTAVPSRDD